MDLKKLAHPPVHVSDTMSLSDFLLEMQSSRAHLAAVVDEHGTTVGLAFREDALEEIVGPLGDEFDDETPEFREIESGTWTVRGSMPFPDLCSRLGVVADDEGEETVAGFLVATVGRLPRKGDQVQLGSYQIEATEVSRRRVQSARVTKLE